GAPGERGPFVATVPWMTSKLVRLIDWKLLKALAAKRWSGATEMEKKPPLSVTMAPYFFSARATACSALFQFVGMLKPALSRSRWPIAGALVFVAGVAPARCVAG